MKRYAILKAAFELQKPRRGVTIEQLIAATGYTCKQVSGAVSRMLALGWMVRAVRKSGEQITRGRVLVSGDGAAMLASGTAARQQGPLRGAAKRGASGQAQQRDERLWRAMRVLGKFTAADLVQQIGDAGAGEAETARLVYAAGRLVRGLAAAGYLTPLRKQGHHSRWLLVDDTGPLVPRVSDARRVVVDPNNGQVRPYAARAAAAQSDTAPNTQQETA
jgi:hypothetical protein